MKNKNAFTLLELIIVIIIVGVLASLALPRFFRVIEGARATEAVSTIGALRQAVERCYIMNAGSYENCDMDHTGPGNTLDMENPRDVPNAHFRYEVRGESIPRPWYSIIAWRNNVDGGNYYNHMIMVGYGIVPEVVTEVSGRYASYASDENLHWDASSVYKGNVPH